MSSPKTVVWAVLFLEYTNKPKARPKSVAIPAFFRIKRAILLVVNRWEESGTSGKIGVLSETFAVVVPRESQRWKVTLGSVSVLSVSFKNHDLHLT